MNKGKFTGLALECTNGACRNVWWDRSHRGSKNVALPNDQLREVLGRGRADIAPSNRKFGDGFKEIEVARCPQCGCCDCLIVDKEIEHLENRAMEGWK